MKLYLYYVFCSVKNQIRKLFKTWVAIFLVICIAIGVVVGLLAASVESLIEDEVPGEGEIVEGVPDESLPDEPLPDEPLPQMSPEQIRQIAEAVISVLLLLIVVLEVMGAEKNGSNIFPMADVNLLFASPMRPQSVLMFRLCCQMGAILFLGVYFLIEVPMIMDTFGLTPLTAATIVLGFALSIAFGKLLNVLLYTLCSTHERLKRLLRPALYTLLGIIALGYFATWKGGNATPLEAAITYFGASWSRYLPVFGWLRAMVMLAWEDNAIGAALCGVLLIGALIGMIAIIRHIRADFYEDALARSSETAELLQAAQENRSTGIVRKKKDRSEKLRRDDFKHGWGANVFFFKTLYNRFRFAHARIFTKTSETYIMAAIFVVLIEHFVVHSTSFLPVALVLSAMVFFRALGNPLAQDVESHVFQMSPADPWAKMFWSLLGGAVNTALDLLPAMLLATVLLGANPFSALAWMLFAVSVDLYSCTACTFITLSMPVSLSKQIQQAVLILFIYFGLLPDVIAIVVGGLFGWIGLGAAIAGAINVVLSALLYAFSPLFLLRGRR